ncbi:MAG: hypothetical protein JWN15_1802 [Firmicutes bacterium]|nr:hypothetical protein [Bacillota bacterium]
MRRYVIALLFTSVLIGSLFKAYSQTGNHWMAMYATIGICFFGIIGTLGINRLQTGSGLKELEAGLKSLGPGAVITDWAMQPGGRPDYLVVGPGGIVTITLDQTAQSARVKRAADRIAKACSKAQDSVRWVRDRLNAAGPALDESVREVPVAAVLVLIRRRALPEHTTADVAVLNPEQLADHIRSLWEQSRLSQSDRFNLTRILRGS